MSSTATYTIGEAAKAAGITTRAARLYEARGLVDPAARSAAGYRIFTDDDVEVFAFIRRARTLGLSLDAIAEISTIAEHGAPCDRTRALLADRVAEIDTAIADLQRLRATITRAQRAPIDQTTGSRCAVIDQAPPSN